MADLNVNDGANNKGNTGDTVVAVQSQTSHNNTAAIEDGENGSEVMIDGTGAKQKVNALEKQNGKTETSDQSDENNMNTAACKVCKIDTTENEHGVIQCDLCLGWTHAIKCLKYSKTTFNVLEKCKELKWFCPGTCYEQADQRYNVLQKVLERQDLLEQKNAELEREQIRLKQDMNDKIQSAVTDIVKDELADLDLKVSDTSEHESFEREQQEMREKEQLLSKLKGALKEVGDLRTSLEQEREAHQPGAAQNAMTLEEIEEMRKLKQDITTEVGNLKISLEREAPQHGAAQNAMTPEEMEEMRKLRQEIRTEKMEREASKEAAATAVEDPDTEHTTQPANMQSLVTDTVREFEERKAKRNNIVIAGLPETEDHESVKEEEKGRAQEMGISGMSDDEVFHMLLGIMHLHESRVKVKKVKRIPGRIEARRGENPKSRPILVEFEDNESKEKVMAAAYQLHDDEDGWSGVFINHDQTRKQREDAYKLRVEKRQREDNGETNLVIRNGKVIQKPPPQHPSHSRPPARGRGARGGRGGSGGRAGRH